MPNEFLNNGIENTIILPFNNNNEKENVQVETIIVPPPKQNSESYNPQNFINLSLPFEIAEGKRDYFYKLNLINENVLPSQQGLVFDYYADINLYSAQLRKELEYLIDKKVINRFNKNEEKITENDINIIVLDFLKRSESNIDIVFAEIKKRLERNNLDIEFVTNLLIANLSNFKKKLESLLCVYEHLRSERKLSINIEDLQNVEFTESGIKFDQFVNDKILNALWNNDEFNKIVTELSDSDWKEESRIKKPKVEDNSELTEFEKTRVDDILQMLSIYIENYKDRKIFRNKITIDLIKKIFEYADSEFYITKIDGKIISFARFDLDYKQDDSGIEYFGSMNSSIKNRGLGNSFMEVILKREKKGVDLNATCIPFDNVSMMYVEKYGFVMTEVKKSTLDTTIVEILKRDENKNYHFRNGVDFENIESVKKSCEEIKEQVVQAQEIIIKDELFDITDEQKIIIQNLKNSGVPFVLKFDWPIPSRTMTKKKSIINKDSLDFASKTKVMSKQELIINKVIFNIVNGDVSKEDNIRYIITRYFADEQILYVAFERPFESLGIEDHLEN